MSIHVFYVPGTNMIGSAAWQNASINTVNTYDQYKRLTNIAVNGENVYGYTLNDKNQRTSPFYNDATKTLIDFLNLACNEACTEEDLIDYLKNGPLKHSPKTYVGGSVEAYSKKAEK